MCTDEEYTDYSDIGSIHIREGLIAGKNCRMPDSMTEPNPTPLELPFCSDIATIDGPNDSVQLIPGLTCIDEEFDSNFNKQMDETEVLQCSKYFSRGFSCVSRKNCVSVSDNSFVQLKFELDSIFIEEIESNAQCPEKEMICCFLENNKLIDDLEKELEFDYNQVTTPMTTLETSKLPPCSKNGPDTNDFIQIPGLTCTDEVFDANFYIESTTILTKGINVQSRSEVKES